MKILSVFLHMSASLISEESSVSSNRSQEGINLKFVSVERFLDLFAFQFDRDFVEISETDESLVQVCENFRSTKHLSLEVLCGVFFI